MNPKYDAKRARFNYLSRLGKQLDVSLCPCCGKILECFLEPELHIAHRDLLVCVNKSCRGCKDGVLYR